MGKRFLPLTGMPIPKMLRSSTLLADCEPDPFTVATWILKSLMTGFGAAPDESFFVPETGCPASMPALSRATSPVAMWRDSLQIELNDKSLFLIPYYSRVRAGFSRLGSYRKDSRACRTGTPLRAPTPFGRGYASGGPVGGKRNSVAQVGHGARDLGLLRCVEREQRQSRTASVVAVEIAGVLDAGYAEFAQYDG